MGCFSFLCKICNKQIICDRNISEEVTLYHLRNGKVIQEMTGKYDSYGRVTDDKGETVYWNQDWQYVCADMFRDEDNYGIAAIHVKCNNGLIPTTKSDDDPNQGWLHDED